MKKTIKPHEPDNANCIFTEGIDYSKTGKKSLWGTEENETRQLLKKTKINGKWMNLCAGDGRFNLHLLKKADCVVACDIDKSALAKLWRGTPNKYKLKLKTKAFNCTKKFPFKDKSFDCVFCAGTLHVFPRKVFLKIFREIDRVLKPNGKIIIDFATNIKRVPPDGGKLITFGNEPQYALKEAEKFLKKTFKNYRVKLETGNSPKELLNQANPPYYFSCKFILLAADKNKQNTKV